MQFYRKTRQSFGQKLIKLLIKIFIGIAVLGVIIFFVSNLELPSPNNIIKQEIPNEKFKVIK